MDQWLQTYYIYIHALVLHKGFTEVTGVFSEATHGAAALVSHSHSADAA